jgi:hypothetical protein
VEGCRKRRAAARRPPRSGRRCQLRALKAHWARTALERIAAPGADDFFAYNVFSASSQDMDRIRELLRATYRQIRAIVSSTAADERVALFNLQLMHWPEHARQAEPTR